MAETETVMTKSLLIIKANQQSLTSAESFLRNREWKVFATTSLKDALTFLVQHKPSFVMVSADHPNKKIRTLPKVLIQAFPVCVIAYTEQSSTSSYRLLLDAPTEYKVNPPVTGPAIERTVNKYIRDQQRKAEEGTKSSQAPGEMKSVSNKEGGSNVITIKHDGPGAPAGDSYSGSSINDILAKLQQEDGDTATPISGANPLSEPMVLGSQKAQTGALILDSANAKDSQNSGAAGALGGVIGGPNAAGTFGNMGSAGSFQGGTPQTDADGNPIGGAIGSSAGGADSFGGSNAAGVVGSFGQPGAAGSFQGGVPQTDAAGNPIGGGWPAGSSQPGFGPAGALPVGPAVALETDRLGDDEEYEDDEADSSGAAGSLGGAAGKRKKKKGKKSKGKGRSGASAADDDFSDEDQAAGSLGGSFGSKKPGSADPNNKNSNSQGAPLIAREIDEDSSTGHGASTQAAGKLFSKKQGPSGALQEDSIIVRGTQKALEESVQVGDGVVKQKVSDSTNVACIVIDSVRFSGYLVAALGKNRRIDEQFISMVKFKLTKFLKENGENIDSDESLNIKIKQVDFEGWALDYAEFLKKSVHHGDEVVMAFFPRAEAKTQVGESASAEMASVSLKDIEPDKPLEFSLYMYLPTNKKYVLYTPKGSIFYSNQKDRLVNQGVESMHMLKTEIQDLSRFRAQNYLNNMIDSYKSQAADKSAFKKAG